MTSFDTLISMAEKKEQRTSQMAFEAIKDLLVHNLLPDRKLKYFHENSVLDHKMTIKLGILHWFEEQLKRRVERVVVALEMFMKSNIEFFKKNCMTK